MARGVFLTFGVGLVQGLALDSPPATQARLRALRAGVKSVSPIFVGE